MAVRLILGAMTQERHVLFPGEMLDEPKRKFLAVILDGWIRAIERLRLKQLDAIAPREFRPGKPPRQKATDQPLARTQVRHPNVVA